MKSRSGFLWVAGEHAPSPRILNTQRGIKKACMHILLRILDNLRYSADPLHWFILEILSHNL